MGYFIGLFCILLILPDVYTTVSISRTKRPWRCYRLSGTIPMRINIEIIKRMYSDAIRSQFTAAELQKAASFVEDESLFLILVWMIKEALKCVFTISLEIPAVEEIRQREYEWERFFKQFQHFKARSFVLDQAICFLVFPKETDPYLDISAITPIMHENRCKNRV